jgi:hypothetical protein
VNLPSRSAGQILVVGYDDERGSILIESLKQPDDLSARPRIELSGRLVRQE